MDAASEEPKDETVLESDKQEGLDGAKSEQLSDSPRPVAHTGAAENIPAKTRDQIVATLYGQCMGDAIGLLSEFYCRDEAIETYGKIKKLEYKDKDLFFDHHRSRWVAGDWTDDSDQMILIMQSLIDRNGEIDVKDFAAKMHTWMKEGFKELGDRIGLGIGKTTSLVLRHSDFLSDPHKAAELTWSRKCNLASNGGVMLTSILGIHDWWDTDAVEKNAVAICKVTHRDPRCLASVVAVCVAISLMLQNKHFNGWYYDVKSIKDEAHSRAVVYLQEEGSQDYIEEFHKYIYAKKLRELELDHPNSIGYTFKCMGAGFWSLKKNDFRGALQKIVLEGGDADTNGAVVGALLGCKLRHTDKLPESWTKFQHKEWLDKKIARYLDLLGSRYAERARK